MPCQREGIFLGGFQLMAFALVCFLGISNFDKSESIDLPKKAVGVVVMYVTLIG